MLASIGEVGIDQFPGSSPVTVSALVDAYGPERAGASRPTRGRHREPPDSASASILSTRPGRRRDGCLRLRPTEVSSCSHCPATLALIHPDRHHRPLRMSAGACGVGIVR
jgi:hypothetical protein